MVGPLRNTLTVQGVGSPVPATGRGEQAGPPSSISSDRNASVVGNLATVADNIASNNNSGRDRVNSVEELPSTINKNGEDESAFFRKSTKMARSPVGQTAQQAVSKGSTPMVEKETEAPARSPPKDNRQVEDVTELNQLSILIEQVLEMVNDKGVRHINQGMKDTFGKMKALCNSASRKMRVLSEGHKVRQVVPTADTPKRPRESSPRTRRTPPKKSRHLEPSGANRTTSKRASPTAAKLPAKAQRAEQGKPVKEANRGKPTEQANRPKVAKASKEGSPNRPPKKEGWTKVTRKVPKTKKVAGRPDAIIVSTKGDTSYADILRTIKGNDALKALGENVTKIRRTQGGDLLLQLKKKPSAEPQNYEVAVQQVLGDKATARTLTKEVFLEVRDIDEVTTRDDIIEAAQQQIGEGRKLGEIVKSLRKSFGETQTALLKVPVEVANRAIERGHIRIGWVRCRVRLKTNTLKCFKCWHYGHMSRTCTSTENRTECCIKCGQKGHKIKMCKATACCAVCKDQKRRDVDHIVGSKNCLAFQDAVKKTNN